MKKRHYICLFIALVGVAGALLPTPWVTEFRPKWLLNTYLHRCFFFVLTFLVFYFSGKMSFKDTAIKFLLLIGFGLMIECLQFLFSSSRAFELRDLQDNLIGQSLGTVSSYLFIKISSFKHGKRQE